MENNKKTRALIILDGWGLRQATEDNAIHTANTPFWDSLLEKYPNTEINTSGLSVGLPEGQMGNSEVGHMSIGAGRVIYQNLTRISKAIEDDTFSQNQVILDAIDKAVVNDKAIHILGLVSPGGVHSHHNHIAEVCKLAAKKGADKLYVHAFLDGRDTPPRSAAEPLLKLEKSLRASGQGQIASIIGRYYAMDRDQRWDRTEKAYRLITEGVGQHKANSTEAALQAAYERGENDEFVQATSICALGGKPVAATSDDVFIFMNFRPDRARQLTRTFIEQDFKPFNTPVKSDEGHFVTLTQYDETFNLPCAYPPEAVNNSLGECISHSGMTQLRIAETEKYAHVTFFFNGGIEKPFAGETRKLVPSPDVASYDLQPEMNAAEVTSELKKAIRSDQYDLIICNYANGDMVGHTGNFPAAVKAVETLDNSLEQVVTAILEAEGECLITADHGNVEQMVAPDTGQPHTAHTSGPVPLVYISNNTGKTLANGSLADIAPTLLQLLALEQPEEMTGQSLLRDTHPK